MHALETHGKTLSIRHAWSETISHPTHNTFSATVCDMWHKWHNKPTHPPGTDFSTASAAAGLIKSIGENTKNDYMLHIIPPLCLESLDVKWNGKARQTEAYLVSWFLFFFPLFNWGVFNITANKDGINKNKVQVLLILFLVSFFRSHSVELLPTCALLLSAYSLLFFQSCYEK